MNDKALSDACASLLANKKIRYVCLIDKMGSLLFEKNQDHVDLFLPDQKSRSLLLKSVLDVSLKKDFDSQIGSLKYNISRRNRIDMITIPMHDNVILITVEPDQDCDMIANNAIEKFEEILNKKPAGTMKN